MAEDEQQLFLIEFIVNEVNVPGIRAMNDEILPALTCVSFQILNLPPVIISQDDPAATNCACLERTQMFKKGKSCLFALPNMALEKELHTFPIIMSVYKKLPSRILPDVMLMGSATIELKNLLNSLMNKAIFKNGNPCKSMKDTFKLSTVTGQIVGDATIFMRASCFGSKIVTQFQMPYNKQPYLFKGSENSPVFVCKRVPSDVSLTTSRKVRGDNQSPRRSCCASPVSPPPPPPTPKKTFGDPDTFSFRPCCPILGKPKGPGARWPTHDKVQRSSATTVSSPRPSLKATGVPKKCGCSHGVSHFVNKY